MQFCTNKILIEFIGLCFLIAFYFVTPAQSNTRYYITDLGQGHARGINEIGQVVGQKGFGSDGHAILWYDNLSIDIGPVGGGVGATAINNDEQVVAISDTNGILNGVFLWEMATVTPLNLDNTYVDIRFDINDLSQVVGNKRMIAGSTSYYHAILWENGNLTDLGTLDPSNPVGISSHANAINEQGLITGFSFSFAGGFLILRAVIWEDGIIKDLGTLGGSSRAYDINETGQVVGTSYLDPFEITYWHAFIWENNEITDLGSLDGGSKSVAYAINDEGKIVGRSNYSFSGGFTNFNAVLWQNGEIYDLNSLIKDDEDWTLLSAYDINNAGQIVGIGYVDGDYQIHAFLLDPYLEVLIDIKPDSEDNSVNINGHGAIPMAILGDADFDATQVDPSTCECSGMAVKMAGKSNRYLAHYEDINYDGYNDLVVQIEYNDANLDLGQETATLTCELYDGTLIEGTDTISIVPKDMVGVR